MNFRFTAFLFVGVVALVITLLIVNLTDPPPRAGAGLLEPLANAGIKPAEVDTVEIQRPDSPDLLVFTKLGEGRWELRQPHPAKVDGAALDGLVRGLFSAKPTRYDGLTGNLAVHGLDKPVKVTLKSKEQSATVAIGSTTLSGVNSSVTFVTSADRATVPVAVPTDDLRSLLREGLTEKVGSAEALVKKATDFRQLRLLSFNASAQGADLAEVKLSQGTNAFALARQADTSWKFTVPTTFGDADNLGDTKANAELITGVQPLLTTLDGFRPEKKEDYLERVPEADLAKYGLAANDPTVIRVEAKLKDGATEVLYIGKAVTDAAGAAVVPTKVYCRLEGDPAVVPVLTSNVSTLAKTIANPSLIRNRDLIPSARKDRIDAADITIGAMAFELRKVGTAPDLKWAVYGGPTGPTEAATIAVEDLIRAACAPRAASQVPLALNDAAFDPKNVRATVKFYFDSVNAPLLNGGVPPKADAVPRESAPPVTLTFGQATVDEIFVRRVIGTGPPLDFLLPLKPREGEKDTLVALVSRPRLAYLNPSIGSFSPAAVAKLTVTRGAETLANLTFTESDKLTEPDKTWFPKAQYPLGKVSNADKPASHPAAQQMLFALAGLDQSKLIAEAPTDADLMAWGLKPARLTVAVALRSAPEKPRVYEFGNEISGTGTMYLRVDGKPFAVAAMKAIVDTVENADLRDSVIQRVERSKHNRFDLYWKAPTGETNELYLISDPKDLWRVEKPLGFKANTAKIETLLKFLELPPAGTFVPGPEKPEYKLNGDVFVAVFNRPPQQPITIYLGAEDETKQFVYAKSSETPGVVKLPIESVRPFLVGRSSLGQ